MKNDDLVHPSDEDLLSAADGELSERRSVQIRGHLEACWACRARMAEIENTIRDVVRLTHETLAPELPNVDRARARFRAQLTELKQTSRPNPFRLLRTRPSYRDFVYALALVLLLVVGTRFLYQKARERAPEAGRSAYGGSLPNPSLTPGAVQQVSLANICSAEHDQVVRKVVEGVREQVFKEYGIAGVPAAEYEIDELVTPGLGGSDDIKNLWPEPHSRTVWNSYVKDQLEDRLHYLVCHGQLNLAVAQHDIASDWISAYRKYFHTNAPQVSAYPEAGQHLRD
jgi:anti-sigma factor RsiW